MTDKSKASDKPVPVNDADLADVTGGRMAVKSGKTFTDYKTPEGPHREETRIVMSGGSTMYEGVVAKSKK